MDKNIIDFSENTLAKTFGKNVADIMNDLFVFINSEETESVSFTLSIKGLSIHIYKSKDSD